MCQSFCFYRFYILAVTKQIILPLQENNRNCLILWTHKKSIFFLIHFVSKVYFFNVSFFSWQQAKTTNLVGEIACDQHLRLPIGGNQYYNNIKEEEEEEEEPEQNAFWLSLPLLHTKNACPILP